MKRAFRVVLLTAAALSVTITASALAKNVLPPESLWQDARMGCLEISEVSKPLSGSDECLQISGSLSRTGPITGYACEEQSTIGFFSSIKASDNSIKPEFFVGNYNAEGVSVQYCARISNDWPPEFNCETSVTFKPVSNCAP